MCSGNNLHQHKTGGGGGCPLIRVCSLIRSNTCGKENDVFGSTGDEEEGGRPRGRWTDKIREDVTEKGTRREQGTVRFQMTVPAPDPA